MGEIILYRISVVNAKSNNLFIFQIANSHRISGMSQIPGIIKSLRASPLGLSQTEIARRTGIPQPRISRWEGGDVAAGADDALRLVALAKEFGVYPDVDKLTEGQGA